MASRQNKNKGTLTMSKVVKLQNSYKEMYEFEFSDGETIFINETFRPSLIEDMLEEFGSIPQELEKEGIVFDASDKYKIYLLVFLCVKYFTSLGKEIKSEPTQMIKQFHALVDSIYLHELMNKGFIQSELEKVFGKVQDVAAVFTALAGFDQKFVEKLNEAKEKVENVKL
ncbi:hypothetical protein AB1283_00555 [Bacillus sp. S13(2024)]|uniref:hypothetical protein n=1 Tax=Bacillus sp. S13(2024) TaxID=3162885 RepID=UPI003D1975AC